MGLLILVAILAFCGVCIFGYLAFELCGGKLRSVMVALTTVCVIVCIASVFTAINHTEGGKRWKKDLQSEFDGGLQRTITIYNQDGEILKSYEGKMDIQSNEGNKIAFVMDSVKYIIYKGDFDTVIVEEQGE